MSPLLFKEFSQIKDSWWKEVFLFCFVFPFSTLIVSAFCLLASRTSAETSMDDFLRIPCVACPLLLWFEWL